MSAAGSTPRAIWTWQGWHPGRTFDAKFHPKHAALLVTLLVLWITVGSLLASRQGRSGAPEHVCLVPCSPGLVSGVFWEHGTALLPAGRPDLRVEGHYDSPQCFMPFLHPGRVIVIGEGSFACILGLALGGILLAANTLFLSDGIVESILSFDSSNFFTCGEGGRGWQDQGLCWSSRPWRRGGR